jgi:hypothetical protein
MMRKYLTLVLAGCCGWTLAGQAAQTTPAVTAPAISDAETVRYLGSADLTLWNEAAKKIKDGEGKVSDGKFYQSRTEDPTSVVKLDIAETHKKGDTMVKDGTALIKDGKATQDKLRKIAADKRDSAHKQAAATAAANFSASIAQWPEAIQSMSAQVLGQLWDQKFTRIYFGGVYSFEEPKYVAQPDLSAQIRDQLRQFDQDKKTLATLPVDNLKLAQENGSLIVNFPARATEAQNGTKSAMIIGEVLYETRNGYAAFSLRAVDLANLHIIASQVMMLSVEPTMAKMLGLPAFRVMARRELPVVPDKTTAVAAKPADAKAGTKAAAAPVVAGPPPAIAVNLQDPNDTLASIKNASVVFRLSSAGHADTIENRFAALMVKAYFHDQQPEVAISDQDFLTMALSTENDGDAAANPADVNFAWVLPNVSDLNVSSIDLDPFVARDLNKKNTTVKIGKITIQRNLPKLSLPSAEELRVAGYTASK